MYLTIVFITTYDNPEAIIEEMIVDSMGEYSNSSS